jgi:hypothetical protein
MTTEIPARQPPRTVDTARDLDLALRSGTGDIFLSSPEAIERWVSLKAMRSRAKATGAMVFGVALIGLTFKRRGAATLGSALLHFAEKQPGPSVGTVLAGGAGVTVLLVVLSRLSEWEEVKITPTSVHLKRRAPRKTF